MKIKTLFLNIQKFSRECFRIIELIIVVCSVVYVVLLYPIKKLLIEITNGKKNDVSPSGTIFK